MKNIKKFLLIIVFMLPINTYADLNLANFIVRNHEISQMPSIGSNDAKYTIVEFFDYRCGYCAKQAADYTNILNKRNDVRIIYLEFPIFGGISEIAANIALVVWNDNSRLYLDIHNEFMKLGSLMNKENIIEILDKKDLDGDEIYEFASSMPFNKTIQLNKNLARDLGLRGTPASIINDTMIPGYVKESKVIEIISYSDMNN